MQSKYFFKGGGGKNKRMKNLADKENFLFSNWYIIDMLMIYFEFFLNRKMEQFIQNMITISTRE